MTTIRGQKMKGRTTTLQPQRRQLVCSGSVRVEISHAASHRARMRCSHFFFLGAAGFLAAAPLEAPPFAAPAPVTTRAHTPIRRSRARLAASRREFMPAPSPSPIPAASTPHADTPLCACTHALARGHRNTFGGFGGKGRPLFLCSSSVLVLLLILCVLFVVIVRVFLFARSSHALFRLSLHAHACLDYTFKHTST